LNKLLVTPHSEVGKKDVPESSTRKSPKPADPEAVAVGSCMLLGIIIAISEGIAIFNMKDDWPKISWVLRAGYTAGLVLGLGLGAALVVLVGGGFVKMAMALHKNEMKAKLNEENAKEVGKGWEKLELEDKEEGRRKNSSADRILVGRSYRRDSDS
jgi:hypothetical protein